MAKKRTGANKSQAIRDYLASNPKATPSEIVEALSGQGVTVSQGLASNVKYTSGAKGRKGKRGKGRVVKLRRPMRGRSGNVSANDLFAAKAFADQVGGIAQARGVLEALQSLT
jgi:hypothetical protein